MDDSRNCEENQYAQIDALPLKYEVFNPLFVLEPLQTHGFTKGNEYPIYEEIISAFPVNGVMCRTVNDNGEMVWKNSQYFNLKGNIWRGEYSLDGWEQTLSTLDEGLARDNLEEWLALARCDIRKEYRKPTTKHAAFEDYMAIMPTWRRLAGLSENRHVDAELQEMYRELCKFKKTTDVLQRKIRELLKKKNY